MGESVGTLKGLNSLGRSCAQCRLGSICLPLAVGNAERKALTEIVLTDRILGEAAHAHRQHAPSRNCLAVRSGAIKTCMVTSTGEERVTGFYFPGDIIGLESINSEAYFHSAITLERTSFCEVPFTKLKRLTAKIPSLQDHFFYLMSKEIQSAQQLSLLMAKNSAEERLAAFLVSLSNRFARRQFSHTRFRLPMSRNDIANYLGVALETVSRAMTHLQEQKLISVRRRELTIHQLEGLQTLAKHSLDGDF